MYTFKVELTKEAANTFIPFQKYFNISNIKFKNEKKKTTKLTAKTLFMLFSIISKKKLKYLLVS